MSEQTSEKLYEYLADEEDARVCTDIDDAACREVPGNFFRIIGSQFFTKLGDALSSPKIVLPWLFSGIGVPAFLTGLLVPLRESGSLLPQLFIGGVVRRYALRKWFFVLGCILQALAIGGMALAALGLRGATAGWVLLALLFVFSLARGLCSVASKDVLGKTIPKTRRGRVGGYSASLAGAVTIGVGIVLALEARGST
ncbi:MAG: MFS transporter, partial [Pseudomonadales bacterium]|nr:MFS transporter [Pseudomonadales bacterium]